LCWSITGCKLKDLLKNVLPYLKIKQEEAKILLEALCLIEEKKGRYMDYNYIKKLAVLQDKMFSIRLKNRAHIRKWTGERIIRIFNEIMNERKRKGHRTGILKPKYCRNCGKPLTRNQIWCNQKYCSHKCYVQYRQKHPEVERINHEYVLICQKPC